MRVIVVGSGIVGAVTAYHLAADGAEVLLVDAGHPGQATFAGAGIIAPWPIYRDEDPDFWWAAADQYPRLLALLAADGEPDPGYAKVGAITVSEEPQDPAPILRARARDASIGEVTLLGPGEPATHFPGLDPALSGLYVSGVGRVDGRLMQAALIRAAIRHGARTLTGDARLVTAGARVTGVEIDGEVHGAHAVVAAAGAWTAALCAPLGVDVPVEPQRGQIAHLTLSNASDVDTSGWPVVRLPESAHYLLAFPGGRIVAGATRETGSGFDFRQTTAGVHQILGDTLRIAPGLADATLDSVRVGFRPASRTGRPILGSPRPGLVVVTGLGHSGLTLAPLAGRIAAALALERPVPFDLPLSW